MYEIFDYIKGERYGVVRKLTKRNRFRCDFAHLHPTREAAETEALRLSAEHKVKFYIVEILAITSNNDTPEVATDAVAAE